MTCDDNIPRGPRPTNRCDRCRDAKRTACVCFSSFAHRLTPLPPRFYGKPDPAAETQTPKQES